jgi:EmrB/QacA subfamily drug resistance transporter
MRNDRQADDRRRWLTLFVCLAGGFIVFLDVSIVNVALPTISLHLHTSGSGLQWIVSGYALSFGLLLVPSGRLGDIHGHRMLFVAGIAVFVAASAVCGAAPSATVLVFGRIVQGAAGGVLTPQISATIQQLFQGSERGRAFGYFASVAAVASAIGPLAGGALIAAFGTADGWRAVFYVNVPIGLGLIPLALMLLPRHVPPAGRKPALDWLGVVLLGVGIVLILLPFIENNWGTWRWTLLGAASADLALFTWWESRVTDPVLDLRLFRHRAYTTGIIVITLQFAAFTPLFLVFTLLLQLGMGYSAVLAGLSITPFAVGSALSAVLSGPYAVRHGRALIATGLLLMLAGLVGSLVAVELVSHHGTGLATLVPMLIAGTGSGLVIAPNLSIALSGVPLPQAGAAGGLLQTGQRIGASIGVAVAGAAFFGTLHGHGTFPDAYRNAIVVISGITATALMLAFIDWRRAGHPSDGPVRSEGGAADNPKVPAPPVAGRL